MKIDRSRARKSTTDIPTECIQLIERLQQCSYSELLDELSAITSWTYGKCELLHWAPVLDIFDKILGSAAEASIGNKWALRCENYGEKVSKFIILWNKKICIMMFCFILKCFQCGFLSFFLSIFSWQLSLN